MLRVKILTALGKEDEPNDEHSASKVKKKKKHPYLVHIIIQEDVPLLWCGCCCC